MTERRPKRPRDPAQLAKLIVDIATGDSEDWDDADKRGESRAEKEQNGIVALNR